MISLTGLALMACFSGVHRGYVWPLDLPRVLTSSFGEYRVRRFHAGIDLHTGGPGKAVHVARDGYVSRVWCSPWGYGKVVYVTLKDGNVAVYAHLSDFYPALRAYVQKAQHTARSYTIELWPKPNEFPVKRGQIIAKTGDTGAGPAHLHFELRDAAEHPFNPRLVGITWPDTTPPVFRKVLVAPETPEDRVNGDILPVILTAHRVGDGYRTDPIRVRGRVGFGVDVIDPSNGNANELGVHTVRTLVGGKEAFRIQHDHLNYDTIHDGAVSYHPFYISQGRFLLQWRWPGNKTAIFHQSKGDGWLKLSSGNVRIEAADFLGNTATVTVPVTVGGGEPEPPKTGATAGGARGVRVDCVGTWLAVTAEFAAAESEAPALTWDGAPCDPFFRVNATTFRSGYMPHTAAHPAVLRVSHPRMAPFEQAIDVFRRGDAGTSVTRDGVTVTVHPDSPYGVLFLTVFQDQRLSAPHELVPQGPGYRLWPEASPIDTPVEISFPAPSDTRHPSSLLVYRHTGHGWEAQETTLHGGRLDITTRRWGLYAAMEDTVAPAITVIEPKNPQHVIVARPQLDIKVSDLGSGVADVSATCDGHWMIMEYDPESGTAAWARDEDISLGQHHIVFRAVDRAGNVATRACDIRRVRRQTPDPPGKAPGNPGRK